MNIKNPTSYVGREEILKSIYLETINIISADDQLNSRQIYKMGRYIHSNGTCAYGGWSQASILYGMPAPSTESQHQEE